MIRRLSIMLHGYASYNIGCLSFKWFCISKLFLIRLAQISLCWCMLCIDVLLILISQLNAKNWNISQAQINKSCATHKLGSINEW